MVRHRAGVALGVLAAALPLLAGCAGGGQPLVSASTQEGEQICTPAPNPGAGITAWNSPSGWALTWFYNGSAAPVEVESVALIDTHQLSLHQALVYEMPHSEHPLIGDAVGWAGIGQGADPVTWARRQAIPGAVIPPQTSAVGTPGPTARDTYVLVLDLSATRPAGGYAIGVQVNYRQGSTPYSISVYEGYAISAPGKDDAACQPENNAITAAWPAPPPPQ